MPDSTARMLEGHLVTCSREGTRFLVFGRRAQQRFVELADLELPGNSLNFVRQCLRHNFATRFVVFGNTCRAKI